MQSCKVDKRQANQCNDDILNSRYDRQDLSCKTIMHIYLHDKTIIELYYVRSSKYRMRSLVLDMLNPALFSMRNDRVALSLSNTVGMKVNLTMLDRIVINRAIRWWKNWAFAAVPVLSKMHDEYSPSLISKEAQQAQQKSTQGVVWKKSTQGVGW